MKIKKQKNIKPSAEWNGLLKCNNYIVDWSPKSGCTTVKKLWYRYLGILNEALSMKIVRNGKVITGWVHNFAPTFWERYGRVTSEDLKNDAYVKIKHVRNPYDRVVSSYIHACKHPGLFENCREYDPSFFDFLNLLYTGELHMDAGEMHWRVQNHNPIIEYDEIIKLEILDNEIIRLSEKYNIDFKVSDKTKRSPHHVKKKAYVKSFFDLPASDVKSYINDHGSVPIYDSFYNDEIKDIVYDIYKLDIDSYDYKYESRVGDADGESETDPDILDPSTVNPQTIMQEVMGNT